MVDELVVPAPPMSSSPSSNPPASAELVVGSDLNIGQGQLQVQQEEKQNVTVEMQGDVTIQEDKRNLLVEFAGLPPEAAFRAIHLRSWSDQMPKAVFGAMEAVTGTTWPTKPFQGMQAVPKSRYERGIARWVVLLTFADEGKARDAKACMESKDPKQSRYKVSHAGVEHRDGGYKPVKIYDILGLDAEQVQTLLASLKIKARDFKPLRNVPAAMAGYVHTDHLQALAMLPRLIPELDAQDLAERREMAPMVAKVGMAPSHVLCYTCGEKGHYQSKCASECKKPRCIDCGAEHTRCNQPAKHACWVCKLLLKPDTNQNNHSTYQCKHIYKRWVRLDEYPSEPPHPAQRSQVSARSAVGQTGSRWGAGPPTVLRRQPTSSTSDREEATLTQVNKMSEMEAKIKRLEERFEERLQEMLQEAEQKWSVRQDSLEAKIDRMLAMLANPASSATNATVQPRVDLATAQETEAQVPQKGSPPHSGHQMQSSKATKTRTRLQAQITDTPTSRRPSRTTRRKTYESTDSESSDSGDEDANANVPSTPSRRDSTSRSPSVSPEKQMANELATAINTVLNTPTRGSTTRRVRQMRHAATTAIRQMELLAQDMDDE
jgi:hypothetical protein